MIFLILMTQWIYATDVNFRPVPQKEMEKVLKSVEAAPPKEKVDAIKKVDLPIYPILKFKDKTYVSIYKVQHHLSKKWEDDLRGRFDSLKKDEGFFYIKGPSAQEFLKELGISARQKIFYRLFEQQKVETIELSKVEQILVVVNGAAGGHFGVAGVEIASDSKLEHVGPYGLAWVGEKNPFTEQKTQLLIREKSMPTLKTVEQLQHHITSNWEKDDAIKFEKAEESRLNVGNWTLIEILYPFRTQRVYQEKLMGYFLKKSDSVIPIKDFYFIDDREGLAERVHSGALLKDYKQVLIFSSMGESDCGLILILKNDDTWVQNTVHCGSWGC